MQRLPIETVKESPVPFVSGPALVRECMMDPVKEDSFLRTTHKPLSLTAVDEYPLADPAKDGSDAFVPQRRQRGSLLRGMLAMGSRRTLIQLTDETDEGAVDVASLTEAVVSLKLDLAESRSDLDASRQSESRLRESLAESKASNEALSDERDALVIESSSVLTRVDALGRSLSRCQKSLRQSASEKTRLRVETERFQDERDDYRARARSADARAEKSRREKERLERVCVELRYDRADLMKQCRRLAQSNEALVASESKSNDAAPETVAPSPVASGPKSPTPVKVVAKVVSVKQACIGTPSEFKTQEESEQQDRTQDTIQEEEEEPQEDDTAASSAGSSRTLDSSDHEDEQSVVASLPDFVKAEKCSAGAGTLSRGGAFAPLESYSHLDNCEDIFHSMRKIVVEKNEAAEAASMHRSNSKRVGGGKLWSSIRSNVLRRGSSDNTDMTTASSTRSTLSGYASQDASFSTLANESMALDQVLTSLEMERCEGRRSSLTFAAHAQNSRSNSKRDDSWRNIDGPQRSNSVASRYSSKNADSWRNDGKGEEEEEDSKIRGGIESSRRWSWLSDLIRTDSEKALAKAASLDTAPAMICMFEPKKGAAHKVYAKPA